jgi:hypothetical protein
MSERICGSCCHFKFEDADGWGCCVKDPTGVGLTHCSGACILGSFVSEEEKRHHLAMLRKCQRCLHENIGTKNDLDVKAIGEAIDFCVDYIKVH